MILMNNMIGVGAILAQAGDISPTTWATSNIVEVPQTAVAFAGSKAGDDFVQFTSRR